jgi:2,3-diketo-5-methylthio-1-phosphopentane phosphatase
MSAPSSQLSTALHSIGHTKVLIWDFDKSLVDANTDDWVPKVLAPDLLEYIRKEYRAGRQWTELMDDVAGQLFDRGFKREDLERALCSIPYHPDMFAALKEASSLGFPSYIVSDANSFYIDTIVRHHGLTPYVTQIITNPSYFEDSGRLRIVKYSSKSEHGCGRGCSNMCKGWILKHKLHVAVKTQSVGVTGVTAGKGGESDVGTVSATATVTIGAGAAPSAPANDSSSLPLVLYVGDGGGDVCAALSLHDGCVACARTAHPMLEELLEVKDKGQVKAKIVSWKDGSDVLAAVRVFLAPAAPSGTS